MGASSFKLSRLDGMLSIDQLTANWPRRCVPVGFSLGLLDSPIKNIEFLPGALLTNWNFEIHVPCERDFPRPSGTSYEKSPLCWGPGPFPYATLRVSALEKPRSSQLDLLTRSSGWQNGSPQGNPRPSGRGRPHPWAARLSAGSALAPAPPCGFQGRAPWRECGPRPFDT